MVLLKKPILIGIAGGTASGKTSLSNIIISTFEKSNSVVVIKEDDYYKNQSHLPMEERVKTNYDHPFAFDHNLLLSQLHDLINGNPINKPTYDYVNHTRSSLTEVIEPAEVVIIEGLFVLENKELRDLLDIKIFVDTPADVRFIRRLVRDIKERGRSMESVVNQYLTTVRVMHEEFIEPTKKYADVIIPEGGCNVVAVDLLTTKISSILAQKMI
ncbi:MAG: uridine kinase [Erysipelotrichaceae bacterium]|nr:uridine kinase [Erysipelotrichaceae bacterium]